ncbi:hypothetical protein, partial [Neisseria meningitidis]|uniref:hypothetical protein n=1 Tax=Neisseria meningitidis TaxID=487 RepID=UPI001C860A58
GRNTVPTFQTTACGRAIIRRRFRAEMSSEKSKRREGANFAACLFLFVYFWALIGILNTVK